MTRTVKEWLQIVAVLRKQRHRGLAERLNTMFSFRKGEAELTITLSSFDENLVRQAEKKLWLLSQTDIPADTSSSK